MIKLNILVLHEVSYMHKPVNEFQDFAERLNCLNSVMVIDFNEHLKSPAAFQSVSRTGESNISLIGLPNIGVPVFKYLYAQIYYFFLLLNLLKNRKVDVIFQYSVFINGFITIYLSKLFNIPVVYRVLDAYHLLRKSGYQSIIIKFFEKYIYRNANIILITNNDMVGYIETMAGKNNMSNIILLEHGVDSRHFKKFYLNSNNLKEKYNIKDEDVVCVFLGTTYKFSRLNIIIDNIDLIKKGIPNFKLLIIGAGELDDEISFSCSNVSKKDDVILTGMIDYHNLPAYLSLGSFGINPFEINDITRDIIPIKILQYQSSSLPVLSTPLPDLVKTIPEGSSGVFYTANDDIQAFVSSIIAFSNNTNMDVEGLKAREFVVTNHSLDKTISDLNAILRGVN